MNRISAYCNDLRNVNNTLQLKNADLINQNNVLIDKNLQTEAQLVKQIEENERVRLENIRLREYEIENKRLMEKVLSLEANLLKQVEENERIRLENIRLREYEIENKRLIGINQTLEAQESALISENKYLQRLLQGYVSRQDSSLGEVEALKQWKIMIQEQS
jgi:hypothetical protein